ncbi:hypothetical protein QUF95_16795 [Paenibacillus silvae]|jgi:hypothetical protein|uniref:DUF6979 family protein n=1 Tax=Paenibacillus silvae TaxID=1325358 RepID=UPI0025A19610|nr:hypothetical protein [Paenibacillus silvae]MDM5279059.1 hypothetical protein [Paenibacillus silvae]
MYQSKYVQAAINAVAYIHSKEILNPVEAWYQATGELFGEGSWGQKKGCPRAAFLGLCEDGYVRGVKRGKYNRKEYSLNKQYAVNTVNLFLENSSKVHEDSKMLWLKVTEGKKIKSNYQVDIVKGLWLNDLILQKELNENGNGQQK